MGTHPCMGTPAAWGDKRCRTDPARGERGHTYSLGLEGRLDLLALQLVPVDVAEECVLLDVPLPLGATAQALGRVLGHQLGGDEERKPSQSGQLCPKTSTVPNSAQTPRKGSHLEKQEQLWDREVGSALQ